MTKVLLAVGALLLATAAVPASAHDRGYGGNGYYNGYGSGYGYYNPWREQIRRYREHQRFHHRLRDAHDQADDQGYYDSEDHSDTHDALSGAHHRWHDNHSNGYGEVY